MPRSIFPSPIPHRLLTADLPEPLPPPFVAALMFYALPFGERSGSSPEPVVLVDLRWMRLLGGDEASTILSTDGWAVLAASGHAALVRRLRAEPLPPVCSTRASLGRAADLEPLLLNCLACGAARFAICKAAPADTAKPHHKAVPCA